mgnify:CR=1 FL=1
MPRLPAEFQAMCNVAIAYEKQKRHIHLLGEHVVRSDVTQLFNNVYQIIGEYKKLIRLHKPTELSEEKFTKIMLELGQDITQSLSLWLTERGMLRDNIDLYTALSDKGQLPDYAKVIMTHADAFVYGRIYTSLVTALENTADYLKKLFTKDTINKAGLTISFREEEPRPLPQAAVKK